MVVLLTETLKTHTNKHCSIFFPSYNSLEDLPLVPVERGSEIQDFKIKLKHDQTT